MGNQWVFLNSKSMNYWTYKKSEFMLDLINGHYYSKRQTGLNHFVVKLAIF